MYIRFFDNGAVRENGTHIGSRGNRLLTTKHRRSSMVRTVCMQSVAGGNLPVLLHLSVHIITACPHHMALLVPPTALGYMYTWSKDVEYYCAQIHLKSEAIAVYFSTLKLPTLRCIYSQSDMSYVDGCMHKRTENMCISE